MTITLSCKAIPLQSPGQVLPTNDGDSEPHIALQVEPWMQKSRDAQYAELYMAALEGNCEAIHRYREIIADKITEKGETVLHIAALARRLEFVQVLLQLLTPEDLQIGNDLQNTALCYAAASGDVNIARLIIKKNEHLPNILQGVKPLYAAALSGQKDMVEYLFEKTKIRKWSEEKQIELLTTCIDSGLYGTARKLLEIRPQLACSENFRALHALASRFPVSVQKGQTSLWKQMVNSVLGLKLSAEEKTVHFDAIKLLETILTYVQQGNNLEGFRKSNEIARVLFTAAEVGSIDVLTRVIKLNPDLLWKEHPEKGNIFHIAVKHRHKSIVMLLFELGSIKDFLAQTSTMKGNNNLLHMAAEKPPANFLSNVSGEALQMQREVMWFKDVENIVPPSFRFQKNSDGKTPQVLFTENHNELRNRGEEWMRHTATKSMFIAVLIALVTFTLAFTVPGANGSSFSSYSTIKPLLLGETLFEVLDALALFSSSTSILMFLSILTSGYAENDFLKSLPSKLLIGFVALFLSIAAMTIAFCTSLLLFFKQSSSRINVVLSAFAFVPLLYIYLAYPLLSELVFSTYYYQFQFQLPSSQLIQKQSQCMKRAATITSREVS